MAPELENYWFAPKSGRCNVAPIVWQGWAVIWVYGAVVAGSAMLVERSLLAYLAVVIVATALMLAICASKTRGGLHWRGRKK